MRKANADLLQQLKAHQIKPKNDYVTETRTYQLITPLFGGGVEASENDPSMLIRATSIRGHLRFWWRATRWAQFDSLQELYAAETAMFGGAAGSGAGSSAVITSVKVCVGGVPKEAFDLHDRYKPIENVAPSYAAFPLNPSREAQKRGVPPKQIRGSSEAGAIEFELTVDYPTQVGYKWQDITKQLNVAVELESAFWAWQTFGGVGARTRRGFGAIRLTKRNNERTKGALEARVEISNCWNAYIYPHPKVRPEWAKLFPSLPQQASEAVLRVINVDSRSSKSQFASAHQAWQFLINQLKAFRQYRKEGIYGPSIWPEADAIRRLRGKYYYKYPPRKAMPDKFPRARFGLPIVFHFKDSGDPKDQVLQISEARDRLASPLILRPYALETRFVGLALTLIGNNTPDELVLIEKDEKGTVDIQDVRRTLSESEVSQLSLEFDLSEPNKRSDKKGKLKLNNQGNVLKAFLDFLALGEDT